MTSNRKVLLEVCNLIYLAEQMAQKERRKELLGDDFSLELLLNKKEKVRVEMHKEDSRHNLPHIHIRHSDKFDISLSLIDFRVLAGEVERKTLKFLIGKIQPKQAQLLEIWNELNEKKQHLSAEKLINSLGLSID